MPHIEKNISDTDIKQLKPLNPVGVVGASHRKNISDTDIKQLTPLNPVGVVGALPRNNILDTDMKQLTPLNPVKDNSGLQIRSCSSKLIFFFLNKTYVVGAQKNRLNETVLLSTQTHVLTAW